MVFALNKVYSTNKLSCGNYTANLKITHKDITLTKETLDNKLNPFFVTGFSSLLHSNYKGIKQFHTQSTNSRMIFALVVWGTNLTSTVGSKFTHKELAMVCFPPYQSSIIIGLLLSDG